MTQSATIRTPDGPFSVIVRDGEVLASGWTADVAALAALVHHDLHAGVVCPVAASAPAVRFAVDAVQRYYAGDVDAPDEVPVRQMSADFRAHAWKVLRQVVAGERVTYGELALRAGRPAAVRAAAGACASNAAALFVPCHRVVRRDGSLGGFRYGGAIKRSLLERESGGGDACGFEGWGFVGPHG